MKNLKNKISELLWSNTKNEEEKEEKNNNYTNGFNKSTKTHNGSTVRASFAYQ